MRKKKLQVNVIRDITLDRQTRNSAVKLRDVMARSGIIEGHATYDASYLSPRIRNAAIKMIRTGTIFGGGRAADTAKLLNEVMDLGCTVTWQGDFTIPQSVRQDPAVLKEIEDLIVADMSVQMLECKDTGSNRYNYSRTNRSYVEAQYKNNLSVLKTGKATAYSGQNSFYFSNTIQLATETYVYQVGEVLARLRTDKQKEAVANFLSRMDEGKMKIKFSFDYGGALKTELET